MTEEDRETMKQEVNIVFHSAATVKFDEELSRAASKFGLDFSKMCPSDNSWCPNS